MHFRLIVAPPPLQLSSLSDNNERGKGRGQLVVQAQREGGKEGIFNGRILLCQWLFFSSSVCVERDPSRKKNKHSRARTSPERLSHYGAFQAGLQDPINLKKKSRTMA